MRKSPTEAQGFKNLPVFASSAIITAICLFFSVSGASAQGSAATSGSSHESERAAQVRALNNSVLQLHGQMQENASVSGATGVRGQAAIVLAQRAAALQALIQEDPHAALTFAFPLELLADLASKFPDSATVLESHVTLSGPVQHSVTDYPNHTSQESWLMNVGNAKLNLYFATRERPDLNAGTSATVAGVMVGSQVAVSQVVSAHSGGASVLPKVMNVFSRPEDFALLLLLVLGAALAAWAKVTVQGVQPTMRSLRQLTVCVLVLLVPASNPSGAAAQSCSTRGVQNVAVLLVTFPGYTNPLNPSDVYNTFFGTSGRSLDGYWREASYGQTSASGGVFGVYTLTGSYSCSTLDLMLNDAIAQASAAGVNFSNYSRIFVVFPDILGCGWAGVSTVGCTSISSPNGNFTASTSYLSTRYMSPGDQAVELVTHEAGHELGLMHSRSRDFSPGVLGPFGVTGTLSEYGDYFSTMGWWNLGHYAAPHKGEVLNWLTAGTTYRIVQGSGTYTLTPFEQSTPGLEALKIQRGSGNNAWLWVEYRQPIGNYDLTLPVQPFGGAQIHYEDSVTGLHTDLLNFTPGDTTWVNTALLGGKAWTDPYSNVSISVLSATSTGLTVSVNYGASPCTSSAPSVSVSPLNPSIYPGQSASYSASVTNNDSSGCSSSTINLGSTEPSGWSTSFSSSSITLGPGQSASVTMGKAAPSGTPVGTYAVNLNASTSASTGSATANATVVTPPSLAVSISVSGSSFTAPATVPVTASVTTGGAPASGASVTFTLTMPTGSTATQSATTNSSGVATWNYKLNTRSAVGNYSVVAQTGLGSGSGSKKTASTQTVASNTATFTVQ